MESVWEMVKLLSFMVFVSSIGAQVWIAILDIVSHFSQSLEKFRPAPVQDKYTRIAVVIGITIWYVNANEITLAFTS